MKPKLLKFFKFHKVISFSFSAKMRSSINPSQSPLIKSLNFLENNIIAKLSLGLQNEIILNTNGYILKKMKFFSINFSEDFLRKLVNKLKKKRFLPEEQIFIENDQEAERIS